MKNKIRVWLVERDYDDKGLLRLTYATPDGERAITKERSPHGWSETTAATAVDPDRLSPVDEPATRERYAEEVDRMMARHDPGDAV